MLTSEQLEEIKERFEKEYYEYEEYYEGDEDRTNTYKYALDKAIEDVRLLLDEIKRLNDLLSKNNETKP